MEKMQKIDYISDLYYARFSPLTHFYQAQHTKKNLGLLSFTRTHGILLDIADVIVVCLCCCCLNAIKNGKQGGTASTYRQREKRTRRDEH